LNKFAMSTTCRKDRPDIGVASASVRSDVFWSESGVSGTQRERRDEHPNCVVWFTVLSNDGKSTIAREIVQKLVSKDDSVEVHVDCSLAECERRDNKGLYEKARTGIITGFTGIDDPYEPPDSLHIRIDTEKYTVEQSVDIIISCLQADYYLQLPYRTKSQ